MYIERRLKFNDHKNCFLNNEIMLKSQQRFKSKAHNVFIEEVNKIALKVVSATFLQVCFLCLKESTFETRKNTFYFTWKALFILKIIKI